jgi:hypothetical protein
VLDRLQPTVAALVTQIDTHSNHKAPTIGNAPPGSAGAFCVTVPPDLRYTPAPGSPPLCPEGQGQ